MSTITQTEAGVAAGYPSAAGIMPSQNAKSRQTEKRTGANGESQAAQGTQKTSRYTDGKTIGEPQLSEAGKKYYEQLKKKYSNLDFILVSEDMKQQAQANAGQYANPNRTVVLINTEKIERMAVDEQYRKQYEGVISQATKQLSQIKDSLGTNAGSVKSFGMSIDDGGNASFFAVIDKSLVAQRERISEKAKQKAEEKKKDQKAEEKKRAEEKRNEKTDQKKKADKAEKDQTVTVTASSVDELIRKINDTIFKQLSDSARTDVERKVGQNFDFSI